MTINLTRVYDLPNQRIVVVTPTFEVLVKINAALLIAQQQFKLGQVAQKIEINGGTAILLLTIFQLVYTYSKIGWLLALMS